MRKQIALLGLWLACLAAAGESDLVKAELLADTTAVRPGEPFALGVLFRMKAGWHIYWKNPGDAGLATSVDLQAPAGFEAGELQWPLPVVFVQPGDVVGYGYDEPVLLWATVVAPKTLAAEARASFGAKVSWLACKDRCVIGRADLRLELPVATAAEPANQALFAAARARLPVGADGADSPLAARVTGSIPAGARKGAFTVVLDWRQPPGSVQWLPVPGDALNVEGISLETSGTRTRLAFQVDLLAGKEPAAMDSLVLYKDAKGERRGVRVPVRLR